MSDIDPVEFGELKAQLAAQRRDIDRMATCIDEMTRALQEIRQTMSEARGGWQAIAWVAGVASTLSGAMTWFLSHLHFPR